MMYKKYFFMFLTCALFFSLNACVTGGKVVKVKTVNKGPAKKKKLSGLKDSDLAKIEEIKRERNAKKEIDPGLSSLIDKTQHFSAAEYVTTYPESRGPGGGDYKVGGFDVMSITVYEEKDLSREAVRVSGDGYISFPLIGRVMVEGLTTSQIERLISDKLAQEQYLLDAHVSAMVTEYNSKNFLVLGAVSKPGSYSLSARERVLNGISKAGGVGLERDGYKGAGKQGMIIRTEHPSTPRERKIVIDLDLQGLLKGRDQVSNIYLQDKDVIYIPMAEQFYIIGEVKNPASYPITDQEITLVEAISMAGGFTPIAARNKTRIIRVEDGNEKIIEVKVDAITKSGKRIQDVVIQPGDVIVVPESFF